MPSRIFIVALFYCLLFFVSTASNAVAQTPAPAGGFALLIGVDKYAQPPPTSPPISDLRGPRNDVALMRDLLIDKYGFSATDNSIVTLLGSQATVAAIRAAFKAHLVENAKKQPDAKVIFYFSGHGSHLPDFDGDEGDGVDETLVAYDSRSAGGQDIVDDEIEKWLIELEQYTSNVTVIFDSCNAGTGTKDIGPAAVVARSLPPNPNMPGAAGMAQAKGPVDKAGLLRGRARHSFISGSLPWELSNEGQVLDEQGKAVIRGLLTHYLVTRLRQQPAMTYAKAVDTITPDILRHARSQHPQADGNSRIPFLGLATDEEQPYIKITAAPAGKSITVAAGEMHGLGPGALLAVYASQTRRLVGETGKLANARAIKVGASSAELELLDMPTRALTLDDKVAIVTPYFGRYRLSVLTDQLPGQSATVQDKKVLRGVAELLRQDRLVQLSTGDNWTVAVQRGCLQKGLLTPASKLGRAPASCTATYYVVTRPDRDRALMTVPAEATDTNLAAQSLASFIASKARQDNLRQLDNLNSPLNGQLKASLVWKGKSGTGPERELAPGQTARLSPADHFELSITNNSVHDLYFAVLVLGSSGSTAVFSESKNGDLIKAGMTARAKPELVAGLPFGFETYKIFATTRPGIDFGVLESAGTRKAQGNPGPLDLLLEDYSNANTRDASAAPRSGLNLDEWATLKVDAEIIP